MLPAAAMAACLALAACSESKLERCPGVSVLVDTGSLTLTQANGSGQPNVLYTVQMADAKRDCDIPKYSHEMTGGITIDFRATRINTAAAATYVVPYFVAITTEGKVLAKQQFQVAFSFQPGETTTAFSDSVNSLALTIGRDKKATDYGILVGFQLTKAQLEYNRRAGRFAK
ncbi:MAG TPA: hypothetical protein VGG69_05740 [Rhizomicrobium sp.]|jgi:hypothetical protein